MIDKKPEIHLGYVHTKTEIPVIKILLFVKVINHLAYNWHDSSLRQTTCTLSMTLLLCDANYNSIDNI